MSAWVTGKIGYHAGQFDSVTRLFFYSGPLQWNYSGTTVVLYHNPVADCRADEQNPMIAHSLLQRCGQGVKGVS